MNHTLAKAMLAEREKLAGASVYYHGSPTDLQGKLREGSYVTPNKDVAYLMGRFHLGTGKPWTDDDLTEPYNFGRGVQSISWKNGREPKGIPKVFAAKIKKKHLDLLNNPYEHKTMRDISVHQIERRPGSESGKAVVADILNKLAAIKLFKVEGKTDAVEAAKKFHGLGQHIPFSGQRRRFARETGMRRGHYKSVKRIDKRLGLMDPRIHATQREVALAVLDGNASKLKKLIPKRRAQSFGQDAYVDRGVDTARDVSLRWGNSGRMVRLDLSNDSAHGYSDHTVRAFNGGGDAISVNEANPIKPTKSQAKRMKKMTPEKANQFLAAPKLSQQRGRYPDWLSNIDAVDMLGNLSKLADIKHEYQREADIYHKMIRMAYPEDKKLQTSPKKLTPKKYTSEGVRFMAKHYYDPKTRVYYKTIKNPGFAGWSDDPVDHENGIRAANDHREQLYAKLVKKHGGGSLVKTAFPIIMNRTLAKAMLAELEKLASANKKTLDIAAGAAIPILAHQTALMAYGGQQGLAAAATKASIVAKAHAAKASVAHTAGFSGAGNAALTAHAAGIKAKLLTAAANAGPSASKALLAGKAAILAEPHIAAAVGAGLAGIAGAAALRRHLKRKKLKAKLQKLAERGPGHSSGTVAEAWERRQMPAWSRGRTAPAEVRHLSRAVGVNTMKYGPQTMPLDSSKRKAPNMNPKVPNDGRTDD